MSALALYLDALFGAEPVGGLIEVRWKLVGGRGMGQEFIDCRRRADAAQLILRRGAQTDTYIGVAPRRRRSGGRDAIERVHVLWADCDGEPAVAALRRFRPLPAIVVRSGSGPNVHAYWSLVQPVDPAAAERANRRLAHALGADPRSTDAARILRPPGTTSHKNSPPAAVEAARIEADVFALADVAGFLPDPPGKTPVRRSTPRPASSDDPLLSIPASVYVPVLTGREPGRDGKVACCFHEPDRTASLHCYETASQGFRCYGCGRSGSIIDFGAALYGIEPRGRGYHEIRERLARALVGEAVAA